MSRLLRLLAIAYFLVQYKTASDGVSSWRYCGMDDFTRQIRAVGGDWSEAECKGGMNALVKVRATTQVLNQIERGDGITRVTFDRTSFTNLIDSRRKSLEKLDAEIR